MKPSDRSRKKISHDISEFPRTRDVCFCFAGALAFTISYISQCTMRWRDVQSQEGRCRSQWHSVFISIIRYSRLTDMHWRSMLLHLIVRDIRRQKKFWRSALAWEFISGLSRLVKVSKAFVPLICRADRRSARRVLHVLSREARTSELRSIDNYA